MMREAISLSAKNFVPRRIFECGQCFRWNPDGEDSYVGVVRGRVLRVRAEGEKILLENTDQKEFDALWKEYFDLGRDYETIRRALSDGGVMDRAFLFGDGLRVLRQEPWETLVSFILSSNNNIARIKKIIEAFCRMFGKPVSAFGKTYYTFPEPERLEGIEAGDLAPLSAGYRTRYLLDAIRKIHTGEVSLAAAKKLDYRAARAELMKIDGVGPKVADCVALFGLGKQEAFPVDVWVRRVLRTLYHKECSEKQAAAFAKSTFGEYAGVAQQYLFYYMRENGRAARNICQEGQHGESKKL